METLEKKPETKVVTLDQVNVRNLPELKGWKQKQQQIVKDHPFVAIEDYKSYEEAKKHRTALVSARTDIQKQDKLIASKLKELRSEAGKVAQELIDITLPHEEKQQEEVKKYEAEKEAERLEKERIEQERKEKIQKSINAFYESWKAGIKELQFENIEAFQKDMSAAMEKKAEEDLEEFEMDLAEKSRLLNEKLAERVDSLKEQENLRIQKAEIAEKELQQKERKDEALKFLTENGYINDEHGVKAKTYHHFIGFNHFNKLDSSEELEEFKNSVLKTKESEEEKLQIEANRKQKEKEAEEKAKKEEEQRQAEEEKRHQKTFEIRCNRLEEVGFSSNDKLEFINTDLNLKLESFHDDVYGMDIEEFEDFIQEAKTELVNAKAEAERKAKEEAEAKEKAAAEEKARKEAEEKRKAELQPDREKLFTYINSLSFSETEPKLKDQAAKDFLVKCQEKLTKLQLELVNEADSIK